MSANVPTQHSALSLPHSPRRFRAVANADPHALIWLIQQLMASRATPQFINVSRIDQYFEIKIEIEGLTNHAFEQLITAVNEMPMIIAAVPYDADWAHP